MALANKNFSIRPGTSKNLQFKWYSVDSVTKVKTPVNLSNYTAAMEVKLREGDETPLLRFSTEDGNIQLSTGTILVKISRANAESYRAPKAYYDLILYDGDGDEGIEFVSGIVTLDKGVTDYVEV